MTSDFIVGLELVAADAVTKWRQVIGPTNSLVKYIIIFNNLNVLFVGC